MTNHEACEAIRKGHRLEKPEKCPQVLWGKIMECWNAEAHLRPSFDDLGKAVLSVQDKDISVQTPALKIIVPQGNGYYQNM